MATPSPKSLDTSDSAKVVQQRIREELENAAHSDRPHLIIDLSRFDRLLSPAVGVIIGLAQAQKAAGVSIILVIRNEQILKLASILRLNELMAIVDSIEDAKKVLGAS